MVSFEEVGSRLEEDTHRLFAGHKHLDSVALQGYEQALVDSSQDEQPNSTGLASTKTVAGPGNGGSERQGTGAGVVSGLFASRTMVERSRRTRESRPKRPARNITIHVGEDREQQNSGWQVQMGGMYWVVGLVGVIVAI